MAKQRIVNPKSKIRNRKSLRSGRRRLGNRRAQDSVTQIHVCLDARIIGPNDQCAAKGWQGLVLVLAEKAISQAHRRVGNDQALTRLAVRRDAVVIGVKGLIH